MKTMRGFAMLKIGETGWVTKGDSGLRSVGRHL